MKLGRPVFDLEQDLSLEPPLEFLEFRVNGPEDGRRLPAVEWCTVHLCDPQDELLIPSLESVLHHTGVRLVNVHARPTDEIIQCEECGARLINLCRRAQRCCYCDAVISDEMLEMYKSNTFASVTNMLASIGEILVQHGKHLVVENTFESPALMRRILDELPEHVWFNLDVGHALLAGAHPVEFIYIMRDRLRHMHLHDNKGGYSEMAHDSHLCPGEGVADWSAISRALGHIGFSGTAVFECDEIPTWAGEWRESIVRASR